MGNTPKIIKEQLSYLNITGSIILKLIENSPADIGGLLIGDIILKIDEKEINYFYDVTNFISNYTGRGYVVIKIFRNNNFYEYKIKLAEKN